MPANVGYPRTRTTTTTIATDGTVTVVTEEFEAPKKEKEEK